MVARLIDRASATSPWLASGSRRTSTISSNWAGVRSSASLALEQAMQALMACAHQRQHGEIGLEPRLDRLSIRARKGPQALKLGRHQAPRRFRSYLFGAVLFRLSAQTSSGIWKPVRLA